MAKIEMEWIPCSEGLPEFGELVLVTIWGGDIIKLKAGESLEDAVARQRREVRYVKVGRLEEEGWVNSDWSPMPVKPVAWMPKVEPYGGEHEEEN